MNLELTADQRELRAVARQALDGRAPLSLARRYLDREPAEPLHDLLAELGWNAVGLEPDDGFGLIGLVLLAEQVGAHAAPTALVDTAVAARATAALDGPAALALREGTVTCALAVLEAGSDWGLGSVSTTLSAGAGGLALTGEKLGVQHGMTADLLLVVANAGGRPAVALVPAGAPGLTMTAVPSLDPAAATATINFADVAVDESSAVIGADADSALRDALQIGGVATAAEGLGAASAALDMAITYAGDREQFGRTIGSFQALKHLLADAHVDREAAWSSVLYAAAALDESLPDASDAAAVACAGAARASRTVVESALQVLGGIAFTWEHDVHLLQRRVLSCERRFGDAISYERRIADRLADGAAEASDAAAQATDGASQAGDAAAQAT
jgi:alkylation response protein AidB-like acyl-CoA dehydrogenase